jgi:hypothetical protein
LKRGDAGAVTAEQGLPDAVDVEHGRGDIVFFCLQAATAPATSSFAIAAEIRWVATSPWAVASVAVMPTASANATSRTRCANGELGIGTTSLASAYRCDDRRQRNTITQKTSAKGRADAPYLRYNHEVSTRSPGTTVAAGMAECDLAETRLS